MQTEVVMAKKKKQTMRERMGWINKAKPKAKRRRKKSKFSTVEAAVLCLVTRKCIFAKCTHTFRCLPSSDQIICSQSCAVGTPAEIRKYNKTTVSKKKSPVDLNKLDQSIRDGASLTLKEFTKEEARRIDLLRIEED
jgi:hypothetical protein